MDINTQQLVSQFKFFPLTGCWDISVFQDLHLLYLIIVFRSTVKDNRSKMESYMLTPTSPTWDLMTVSVLVEMDLRPVIRNC